MGQGLLLTVAAMATMTALTCSRERFGVCWRLVKVRPVEMPRSRFRPGRSRPGRSRCRDSRAGFSPMIPTITVRAISIPAVSIPAFTVPGYAVPERCLTARRPTRCLLRRRLFEFAAFAASTRFSRLPCRSSAGAGRSRAAWYLSTAPRSFGGSTGPVSPKPVHARLHPHRRHVRTRSLAKATTDAAPPASSSAARFQARSELLRAPTWRVFARSIRRSAGGELRGRRPRDPPRQAPP